MRLWRLRDDRIQRQVLSRGLGRNAVIIRLPRWLLIGNNGAGWLPNVTLIANDMPHRMEERVIANEQIHQLQQDELGYFRWVFKYLLCHFRYGYHGNPFEIDSRVWDENLDARPARYWEQCESRN